MVATEFPDAQRPLTSEKPPSIIEVRNLRTGFFTGEDTLVAVDDVDLHLRPGETLGVVGESGCGKSVTALSILRLIPPDAGKVLSGQVLFEGRDLLTLPEKSMRSIRGNAISMIFQDPMSSLNPVLTVGEQIAEAVQFHQGIGRRDAFDKATEMLQMVRIADPARRAREYPHQMSGGMRQRVMIAMALSCEPRLLIADEPTTALDVTIQGQILDLILELKERLGTAVMMISHNLGVIAETAQRAMVMYAGRKVEEAAIGDLFASPKHPYTRGLLASAPVRRSLRFGGGEERLREIPGMVPSLGSRSIGCSFAPRCAHASEVCRVEVPALQTVGTSHIAACWHPQ